MRSSIASSGPALFEAAASSGPVSPLSLCNYRLTCTVLHLTMPKFSRPWLKVLKKNTLCSESQDGDNGPHRRTNDLRIFARIALSSRFCNGAKSALMHRQSGHLPEPPFFFLLCCASANMSASHARAPLHSDKAKKECFPCHRATRRATRARWATRLGARRVLFVRNHSRVA